MKFSNPTKWIGAKPNDIARNDNRFYELKVSIQERLSPVTSLKVNQDH